MLKRFFQRAKKEGWAIGQFNFSTLEQLKGICLAARESSAPVILGTSEGESRFLGLKETVALLRAMKKKVGIQLFLHLDHGRDLVYIKKAIDAGYDSVHFDGSLLSFSENIKLAKKVVKIAHEKNVFVEGELGYIKGESVFNVSSKPKIGKQELVKPEQVKEFVEKTGIDSLAVALGSIHGIYYSSSKIDFEKVDLKRLGVVRTNTDVPLVLHGASGVAVGEIKKSIKKGIQKININTELRVAWRKVIEKSLKESKTVKPYSILLPIIQATKIIVEKYIKLFGSNDKVE